MEDVVILWCFIEFGRLGGVMGLMRVEDDGGLCYGLGGMGIEVGDGYDGFEWGRGWWIGV